MMQMLLIFQTSLCGATHSTHMTTALKRAHHLFRRKLTCNEQTAQGSLVLIGQYMLPEEGQMAPKCIKLVLSSNDEAQKH